MVPQCFKPNPRYLYKLLVVYTVVALLILAGILLLRGGWIDYHRNFAAAKLHLVDMCDDLGASLLPQP